MHSAYWLLEGKRVMFMGYVDGNGASRFKLKKMTPLNLDAVAKKLAGVVFTSS
jgi:predicted unusual protein kinase regulating ubiquinone biosynthesis (AarF/ABC1/UbiB family)